MSFGKLISFIVLFLFVMSCSNEISYDANIYHDFAQKKFRHLDNTITLNVIPTTYPLEWTSPRNLIYSLVKNQYFFPKTKHNIGHVTVEVNCKVNNEKIREFIGQTSLEKGGFKKYLQQGYGFSILNRPQNNYDYPNLYVKGRLDYENQVFKDYAKFLSENLMSVISVEVSPRSCQKAMAYIQEYKARTQGSDLAGNVYGFGADPTNYEGAGCAPLAQTVLEKAGLYSLANAMDQTVYIPKELIGDPKKNKIVSIKDLILADIDMSENKTGRVKFTFPDPQGLMDYFKQEQTAKNTAFLLLDERRERFVAGASENKNQNDM